MAELKNISPQPTEEVAKPSKTSTENYKSLKAITEALDTDFTKFQGKKVKASGNRVRNNLLNIKKLCDVLRKQILADINEIPTKHRITKDPQEVKEEETVSPEDLQDLQNIPEPPELVRETTEVPQKVKKPRKPRKPRKSTKTTEELTPL